MDEFSIRVRTEEETANPIERNQRLVSGRTDTTYSGTRSRHFGSRSRFYPSSLCPLSFPHLIPGLNDLNGARRLNPSMDSGLIERFERLFCRSRHDHGSSFHAPRPFLVSRPRSRHFSDHEHGFFRTRSRPLPDTITKHEHEGSRDPLYPLSFCPYPLKSAHESRSRPFSGHEHGTFPSTSHDHGFSPIHDARFFLLQTRQI
jgi:hypothetical protein